MVDKLSCNGYVLKYTSKNVHFPDYRSFKGQASVTIKFCRRGPIWRLVPDKNELVRITFYLRVEMPNVLD